MKKIYRSGNYVEVNYDGTNLRLYPIGQVQLSEFGDHFLIENRIENQPVDTQVSFARIGEWFNEAGDTAYTVATLRTFFEGLSVDTGGIDQAALDAAIAPVQEVALKAQTGYSHSGAFADKPLSNNYVWEAGAGIEYTQANVDADLWRVFSLSEAVHLAVDNPYWSTPTPSGTTGIGLFQGANLPDSVSSLFDYTFDYDAAYPSAEIELWGIVNGGGNRDSGNNVSYIDENGVSQTLFVGNNGSSASFLSTTEHPIATVTGDPFELKRLAKGQAAIDALGYPFSTQNQFDTAFAAGESTTTVQAEYDANTGGGAATGFEGTTGRIKLNDAQYGDQLRVRFDFNIIPQIANTTVEPALWYSNRDDNDNITFTFPLTAQPIFYGQGTVGKTFLNRVEISAWITSNEDVNALTLPAIKSDNPVIIQPLGLLVTLLR